MKAYVYDKENELLAVMTGTDWEGCIDKVVEQFQCDEIGDFYPKPLKPLHGGVEQNLIEAHKHYSEWLGFYELAIEKGRTGEHAKDWVDHYGELVASYLAILNGKV